MVLRLILLLLFSNIVFANELKTITAEEYLKQNPSIERKAILDFITGQFKNKKVSQEQLNILWNDNKIRDQQKLIRIQIVDQQLYMNNIDVEGLFFLDLQNYFQRLLKIYKINDLDLIIYGRDEIANNPPLSPEIEEKIINIPAFMLSKDNNSPYENNKFLLTDGGF